MLLLDASIKDKHGFILFKYSFHPLEDRKEWFNYLFLASLISLFIVGSSVLPGVSPTEDAITTV